MGSEKSAAAEAAFARAKDADRRVAGVAAAARAAKALADSGARRVRLLIGDGGPLAPATLADLERLRGTAAVVVARGEGPPANVPSAWAVVRATGKPGDGLVSRLLNRPISQCVTWLVLKAPGARPVHVTVVNALLALIMFPILLGGGEAGLVAGGFLFQAASVLDGVDGEMARATWRSTPTGATMDSMVDIATNLLFVAGLTANLAWRDGGAIGWIGGWALLLSTLGGALIARRARAGGAPLGFDHFKRRSHRIRGVVDLVYLVVQTLTGRDCFAFLFMALILVGQERTALSIYAGVGTVWIGYILFVSLPRPREFRNAA